LGQLGGKNPRKRRGGIMGREHFPGVILHYFSPASHLKVEEMENFVTLSNISQKKKHREGDGEAVQTLDSHKSIRGVAEF